MKYALVDNNKTEATKEAKGFCLICSSVPQKVMHYKILFYNALLFVIVPRNGVEPLRPLRVTGF